MPFASVTHVQLTGADPAAGEQMLREQMIPTSSTERRSLGTTSDTEQHPGLRSQELGAHRSSSPVQCIDWAPPPVGARRCPPQTRTPRSLAFPLN
jgi:hypothetical protein